MQSVVQENLVRYVVTIHACPFCSHTPKQIIFQRTGRADLILILPLLPLAVVCSTTHRPGGQSVGTNYFMFHNTYKKNKYQCWMITMLTDFTDQAYTRTRGVVDRGQPLLINLELNQNQGIGLQTKKCSRLDNVARILIRTGLRILIRTGLTTKQGLCTGRLWLTTKQGMCT